MIPSFLCFVVQQARAPDRSIQSMGSIDCGSQASVWWLLLAAVWLSRRNEREQHTQARSIIRHRILTFPYLKHQQTNPPPHRDPQDNNMSKKEHDPAVEKPEEDSSSDSGSDSGSEVRVGDLVLLVSWGLGEWEGGGLRAAENAGAAGVCGVCIAASVCLSCSSWVGSEAVLCALQKAAPSPPDRRPWAHPHLLPLPLTNPPTHKPNQTYQTTNHRRAAPRGARAGSSPARRRRRARRCRSWA